MVKLLICIAFVCVLLVAVNGRPGGGGKDHGGSGGWGSGGGGDGHGGSGGGGDGHGGSGGGGDGHGGSGGGGDNGQWWISKLCKNGTNNVTQTLVTQLQQLITTYQGNTSFTQALQKRANEIAYLQNPTNTALLSSNCTQYFTGLSGAKSLDQAANDQEQQYEDTISQSIWQLVASIFGNNH